MLRSLTIVVCASVSAQSHQFAADQNRALLPVIPADVVQEQPTIGDLDGDGDGDIVTRVSSQIRVHLQQAPGVFTSALAGPIGAHYTLTDVDGDLDLDLLVGSQGSQLPTPFHVWANNGTGVFPQGTTWNFLLGSTVNAFAPGDFDGDGDIDLVLGTSPGSLFVNASPYLRYYRNLGGGSLTPSTSALPAIATPGCRPTAGDFDGDGDLDLVVGIEAQPTIFLRNQAGFFTQVVGAIPVVAADHVDCRVADFDGDGDLDVLARTRTQRVDLLKNDGTGTFLPAGLPVPAAIAIGHGDTDGDGDQDLVLLTTNATLEFANQGFGTFVARAALSRAAVARQVAVGDVDGDGFADALTTWDTAPGSIVTYGSPVGLLADPLLSRRAPVGISTGIAASFDVDVDGLTDVVLATGQPGGIAMLQNLGVRGWAERTLGALSVQLRRLHLVDRDHDGDLDLAAQGWPSAQGGPSLQFLRNDGAFAFTDLGVALNARAVAFGDVDGDGDDDMVTAEDGWVRLYLHTAAGLQTTNGVDLPVSTFLGYPNSVLLEDIDGDGDRDVVTGKTPNGCMDLLVNDGAGTFTLRAGCGLPRTSIPAGMLAGDVDGDLDVDVLMFDVNGLHLFVNDGRGTFTDESAARLPAAVRGINVADLVLFDADADGDLDLVVDQVFGENNGRGTFVDASATRWGVPTVLPRHAVDLDGDGDPDALGVGGVAWNHLRQVSTTAVPLVGGALSLSLALEAAFATAGGFGLVAVGFAPRQPALAVPGIAGVWQIQTVGTLPLVVPPAPGGVAPVGMPIPSVVALKGLELHCQALCVTAAGRAGFTNAVLERIR
jgi:hypothetical protein